MFQKVRFRKGHKNFIMLQKIPKGVIVLKGFQKGNLYIFQRFRLVGFLCVSEGNELALRNDLINTQSASLASENEPTRLSSTTETQKSIIHLAKPF